jgi:hypothetical protein
VVSGVAIFSATRYSPERYLTAMPVAIPCRRALERNGLDTDKGGRNELGPR